MFLEDKKLNPGVKVEADPFSLDALIAWLEKQPGEKTYCYTSNGHCLIAQYMKTLNIGFVECDPANWYDGKNTPHPLPPHFDDVANDRQNTFGAALQRARALKAS